MKKSFQILDFIYNDNFHIFIIKKIIYTFPSFKQIIGLSLVLLHSFYLQESSLGKKDRGHGETANIDIY